MIEVAKIGARLLGSLTGLFALLLFGGFLWMSVGLADESGVGLLVAAIASILFLLSPALVAAYGLVRLRSWAIWLEIVVLGVFTLFDYRFAWVSIPVITLLLLFRGPYMIAAHRSQVSAEERSVSTSENDQNI